MFIAIVFQSISFSVHFESDDKYHKLLHANIASHGISFYTTGMIRGFSYTFHMHQIKCNGGFLLALNIARTTYLAVSRLAGKYDTEKKTIVEGGEYQTYF